MPYLSFLVLAILAGCSPAFTSGDGGAAGATSSSGGSGGTIEIGGGGAGGSIVTAGGGGTVETGGSGGTVTTGGSGGSPATILLEWTFNNHPPNVNLGIAGIIDFPAPTPDIDPIGRAVLQSSCLAPQATDNVVSCDVGVAESGTVLHIDLNSYDGGNFIFYHCDDPAVVGAQNAKCEGELNVYVGGSLFASCSGTDPLASPCAAEVNSETLRRRYVIHI